MPVKGAPLFDPEQAGADQRNLVRKRNFRKGWNENAALEFSGPFTAPEVVETSIALFFMPSLTELLKETQ